MSEIQASFVLNRGEMLSLAGFALGRTDIPVIRRLFPSADYDNAGSGVEPLIKKGILKRTDSGLALDPVFNFIIKSFTRVLTIHEFILAGSGERADLYEASSLWYFIEPYARMRNAIRITPCREKSDSANALEAFLASVGKGAELSYSRYTVKDLYPTETKSIRGLAAGLLSDQSALLGLLEG